MESDAWLGACGEMAPSGRSESPQRVDFVEKVAAAFIGHENEQRSCSPRIWRGNNSAVQFGRGETDPDFGALQPFSTKSVDSGRWFDSHRSMDDESRVRPGARTGGCV